MKHGTAISLTWMPLLVAGNVALAGADDVPRAEDILKSSGVRGGLWYLRPGRY